MKKTFLFTLLTVLVSAFTMAAESNVTIVVDTPANVTVTTAGGNGRVLNIEEGYQGTRFTDLSTNEQPLLIEANDGATITEVTKNGETAYPSYDGKYRLGYDETPTRITVATSGSAGGPTVKNIAIAGAYGMGEGISGNPFTFTYDNEGVWTAPSLNDYGWMQFPENSTVKVTPNECYKIESITYYGRAGQITVPISEPDETDGSVTFTCTSELEYNNLNINMSVDPAAARLSITVDYAPNLSAAFGNGLNGAEVTWLTLYTGENKFICLPKASPVEFFPTTGASIVSVTRNGEELQPNTGGWSDGWVFEFEDGDSFVVTTKGKPIKVNVNAAEDNPSLDSYIFTDSRGKEFDLKGTEAVLNTNNGEKITVAARPGRTITSIWPTNGGKTDYKTYFQAVEGADGVNPQTVSMYGTCISGVVINVNDAAGVEIKQGGGHGDALTLANGENKYKLSDLENALVVSAKEGNQLLSVSVNGKAQVPQASGVYSVIAVESDYIDVVSRKSPVDVNVTFNFLNAAEGANIKWLSATVEGQAVENLTSPLTIKTYDELILSPRDGYEIKSLTYTGAPGTKIEKIGDTDSYSVIVTDTRITEAPLSLIMAEVQPEEGYAIVIPTGDATLISFTEMEPNEWGGKNTVKALDNNTVNQVKIGNTVRVMAKASTDRFRYVRVNGEPVETTTRYVYLEITGRTEIEAEVYTPIEAYTQDSFDDVKLSKSGTVYIEVDGENKTSTTVEKGQTIKLVAAPEKGYVLDHFEIYRGYSTTGEAIEGDTYTISELDATYESLLFKGAFKVNEEEKSYVLRGDKVWLQDENGTITNTEVGRVGFRSDNGVLYNEFTALGGEVVKLEAVLMQECELVYFCFSAGFPNNKIDGWEYTVDPDDANSEGIIWISAVVKDSTGTGVEGVVADKLSYNAADATLSAPAAIEVYDLQGNCLLSTEETSLSVANLPAGLYIAVSGKNTIKFVR